MKTCLRLKINIVEGGAEERLKPAYEHKITFGSFGFACESQKGYFLSKNGC